MLVLRPGDYGASAAALRTLGLAGGPNEDFEPHIGRIWIRPSAGCTGKRCTVEMLQERQPKGDVRRDVGERTRSGG